MALAYTDRLAETRKPEDLSLTLRVLVSLFLSTGCAKRHMARPRSFHTSRNMAMRAKAEPPNGKAAQKGKISQTDVPAYSLEEALRVPRAIADQYAAKPTKPLNVAGAMSMQPNSGPFRMLAGAALAYGLTTGGAFAPDVGVAP